MNQGPVPSRVYDALKALSGRGDPRDRETQQVANRLAKYLAHDGGIRFRVLEDADVGALSEPDVEYLDEVGERYGRQSFPGLPALTHDAAYEVARARAESQSA